MDDTSSTATGVDYTAVVEMLNKHAGKDAVHYEMLEKQIRKLGETNMSEVIIPGGDGMLGGAGAGLGAGLLGGVLGGQLFGNNNRNNNGDNVTNAALQAALNGQTASNNTNAIMQSLATVQQLIPTAEGQVQLALAQAQIALQNTAVQGQLANAEQHGNVISAVSDSRKAVNDNIDRAIGVSTAGFASVAQQLAGLSLQGAQQTYALDTAVRNDGDKTRALIVSQYETTLNRQLSEAHNEIIELRGQERLNGATRAIEINTTNNIAQAQAQQQQQQQQANLANLVNSLANDLQYIRSTNQAINIGSGVQQANPQNTNTNVRA